MIDKKNVEKNLAKLKNADIDDINKIQEILKNLSKQIDVIKNKNKPQCLTKINPKTTIKTTPKTTIKTTDIAYYKIWTDGACSGNPGIGGWAALIHSVLNDEQTKETIICGNSLDTTNNIMELTAAVESLQKIPKKTKIHLYTDSQYLQKGMTEWLVKWKKRNWKKTNGKPILNQELWRQLDKQKKEKDIKCYWIKAHSQIAENELCDKLARQAINKLSKTKANN